MSFLEQAWYKKSPWLILLWPVSILFRLLAAIRRRLSSPTKDNDVPLIVVGNISVGGTGKTPLLLYVADYLLEKGMSPGIISRGYGGNAETYPLDVDESTPVSSCGDEPYLIAEHTSCPVVVDPDRSRALEFMLKNHDVDIVLSDDGMQHYNLRRDIEIAVVDGQRLFGNGFCLPAGPLREPVSRLKEVDFIVINGEPVTAHSALESGYVLSLKPRSLVNLCSGEQRPFGGAPFNMGNRIQAVSALGNPQRFYELLEKLPYGLDTHSFPDHHGFTEEDFESAGIDTHQPVVMTEKDAVKCRSFAKNNFWYLSVEVEVQEPFADKLWQQLENIKGE